jgi:hypothetical protein
MPTNMLIVFIFTIFSFNRGSLSDLVKGFIESNTTCSNPFKVKLANNGLIIPKPYGLEEFQIEFLKILLYI